MAHNSTKVIFVAVLISLLFTGVLSYYLYSNTKQVEQQLKQDYQAKLQALDAQKSQEINKTRQELTEDYETKILLLQDTLSSFRTEYKQQNKDILNIIEDIQTKTNTNLQELKQQLDTVSVQSGDLSVIVDDVLPAIVSIRTDKGLGSGSLISDDGYIVTNYHVVDGITRAAILTYNNQIHKVRIAGTSPQNDIALLKIDVNDYPYLEFGDSDKVKAGERVLALGNPLGLDFTVTEGIISAVNRRVSDNFDNVIQTDVPINPGNSGGPLIDKNGKIIGINTFKITGAESLGFAIPSNKAVLITREMQSNYEQALAAQAQQ